jgi:hypothetical protein
MNKNDLEMINDKVFYKGLNINITLEQIQDLQIYGVDVFFYIEKIYKQNLQIIRDEKLNEILKDKDKDKDE